MPGKSGHSQQGNKMFAYTIESGLFQTACRSAAAALIWGSGEDYDEYDVEDFSEETLEWVAGEMFATFLKLRHTNKLNYLTKDGAGSFAHSCMLDLLGCGSGIRDHKVWPFAAEDLEDLSRWQDKRHKHTIDIYIGDDNKIYVSGKERRKPIGLKMSISEGFGRFGAMFDFQETAVSVDAAAVKAAMQVQDWDKTWIRGYEETPL